jgi:hypothetical protein
MRITLLLHHTKNIYLFSRTNPKGFCLGKRVLIGVELKGVDIKMN